MKGILVFAPWAAGGFEDTELGVNIEPEMGHGARGVYTTVQDCGSVAVQGPRGSRWRRRRAICAI